MNITAEVTIRNVSAQTPVVVCEQMQELLSLFYHTDPLDVEVTIHSFEDGPPERLE